MQKITEYLKKVFEEFERHCDAGTQCMWELSMKGLKNNSPRLKSDGSSIYRNPAAQQMYLLKYAYAYGFEYLAMCNEFIEDFANKEKLSVVSLGCGTMLDYWALACMLDEKKISRPVVHYLGIDAISWKHTLETEVRARDKKTFRFSQESFADFFQRPDNSFHTHDIYFFPKSISEFSDRKNGKSDMELMLNRLSGMEKDTVYFCISLRKNKNGLASDDVGKVQKIIDRLKEEKNGFRVKDAICITDTENTIDKLKEKGLRVENVTFRRLGKNKNIWDTDVAKNMGGYPPLSEDDPMLCYLQNLKGKCVYSSPEKDNLCEECTHYPCEIEKEQTMKKTNYICDLIIKFERG